MRPNYFPTLSAAHDAEGLAHAWPITCSLAYGQTVGLAHGGRWISVYRDDTGRYERPVHYATQMADTCPIHLS